VRVGRVVYIYTCVPAHKLRLIKREKRTSTRPVKRDGLYAAAVVNNIILVGRLRARAN